MKLPDARAWFRYRSKMSKRVKGNTPSALRNYMNCRHCDLQEEETQEHLEVCEGTKHMRAILDMTIEDNHKVFWRKLSRKLDETTNTEIHDKNMESNLPIGGI